MLTALSINFAVALALPFLHDRVRWLAKVLAILLPAALFAWFCTFLSEVANGESIGQTVSWLPAAGISLTFYLDGLSLTFALLVSFFGLLVVLYSIGYMKHEQHQGRFFGFLLFFMAAMLGMLLADNLISLFAFWELTSISSFLLIGFKYKKGASRYAARQALLLTSGGGLALMAGFILLQLARGTFQLSELLAQPGLARQSGFGPWIAVLVLAGAFTKSAQFPFHFWLPNAMEAPTPVSAFLHSATMVKAGVYLVFRLNPLLASEPLWQHLLMGFGGFTMIFAAFKATKADDVKAVLAYTTISALGIFFMMIGQGSKEAVNAALVYVLAHAFYKGGLFMVAGAVDHEAGTRQLSELSGLYGKMPLTGLAAMLACISMAGVLPALGFVGKELLYKTLFEYETGASAWLLALLVLASSFFVLVCLKIGFDMLFGQKSPAARKAHRAPLWMSAPALALGGLGLLAGSLPGLPEPLLKVAADNIYGEATELHLKLWHGFNAVFWLSMGTLLLGGAWFALQRRFHQKWQGLALPAVFSADRFYRSALHGLSVVARGQTRFLQNGYLRNYLSVVVMVFVLLVLVVAWKGELARWQNQALLLQMPGLFELAILVLVLAAIVVLILAESRMVVVATLSIAGYGLALAYTLFSAPDVAMTQFAAETVGLMLFIIILHRMPVYKIKNKKIRLPYVLVSVVFGLLMGGLALLLLEQGSGSPLKDFFLRESLPKGKGQNVVNVILVDFRALDTLGEITVLAITMTGIFALLRPVARERLK